jgi:hypothetical protein
MKQQLHIIMSRITFKAPWRIGGMKAFNKASRVIVTVLAASVLLGFIGPIAAFAAGPAPVDLQSASNFVILAKTQIWPCLDLVDRS